ncbi:hypothetical protein OAG36_01100 [bacterium]|nr:hypothetical protein [bacterium]
MKIVKLLKNILTTTLYYSEESNWDDLKFPATAINPPGAASDPDRDSADGTLLFDAGGTELVVGIAQLPHAWREGSPLRPHVHWAPTDANSGDVLWRFSYDIANVNGVFAGSYTDMDILAAADGNALKHQIKGFGDLYMSSYTLSCIIKWKLARIGGDGTDTYSADSRLLEFDIHYEADSVGSGLEFQK